MTLVQTKVGSVGVAWPPRYDAPNNRLKGFYPRLVPNVDALASFLRTTEQAERQNPKSTRTTVRAFVRRELVETIVRHTDIPYKLEATVPVDQVLPGFSMVYLARNDPSRMPEAASLEAELRSVNALSSVPRVSIAGAATRVSLAGYAISPIHSNGEMEADVTTMLALYREAYQRYTFDITRETIGDMLNNGNIVIVGRDCHGEIVSSLIAEHCAIQLEGGTVVHLYELSDYATFRQHRGNGLITAMQMDAIRTISHLHPEGNAVTYAEDRAAWEAVNISSQKAGLTYCGTILQHCVLVSDRSFGETGVYENLNVWAAIPRSI